MTKSTKSPAGKREPVDWENVRRRLDTAQAAIGHIGTPGPEDRKRILKERARLLAVEERADLAKEEYLTVVEFMLASEHYGIESAYIREILQIRDLTHLPGTPAFLLGIVNIRGEICPVINLKKFFSLADRGLPEFNKVMVLYNEKTNFGIVADSITGTRRIPAGSLKPPPPTFTGLRAEYIKGVSAGPVIVLDGEKILADRSLVVNEQV